MPTGADVPPFASCPARETLVAHVGEVLLKERFNLRLFDAQALVIDVLLAVTVTALVFTGVIAVLLPVPQYVAVAAVGGLTLVSIGSLVARFITRPDHLQAQQSHRLLEIANKSLPHLRRGLHEQTAGAVCLIALEETEAAAVAITDTECVLGFAGIGEDHHLVGGPIITRATRDALDLGEHRVLSSKAEIGCPLDRCLLQAAIVVPLVVRGEAVGTLKFYYTTPRLLNETQVTMAEGLAELLSTQLELSELDRQTELATRMELQALQAQIHPHFLFNTINTIASLIRTDPVRARLLLREFAAFYRRTLESSEDLVPLDKELEYARTYLMFERARFGDRIRVHEDIEADARGFRVPAFILQPLVENCVQHGMRQRGALEITLEARLEYDALHLRITDDGVGIPADRLPSVLELGTGRGLGIALKNVDDRLKGRFGQGSGIAIASVEDEGTTVTVTVMPAREVRDEE